MQTLVGFSSSERLGEFTVVLCCCCFVFGLVWRSVGLFGVLEPSGLDRSNRCRAVLWKSLVFTSRDSKARVLCSAAFLGL
jgi:hypothetical protein